MPATGSILLDTTVVVSFLRRVSGMHQRLVAHDNHSSQPEKQRLALTGFLQGVDVLFPDEATTREYGRIKAELARAGTPIPENDVWIAAQAMEGGLPLATCDAHFERIQGLTVRNWR